MNDPANRLLPLALQQVELRSALYERGGAEYRDISSVKKVAQEPEEEQEP